MCYDVVCVGYDGLDTAGVTNFIIQTNHHTKNTTMVWCVLCGHMHNPRHIPILI